MIAAEYLPGELHKEADFQFRNEKHLSKWKLDPMVYQKVFEPRLKLFAS